MNGLRDFVSNKALNLACGSTFIESPMWVNVDWSPSGSSVVAINLVKQLPFADNSFDLVYTSHFIEHLFEDDLNFFLMECFRILTPGGIIRIVTPDWDEMVIEYVSQINKGNFFFANYVKLEILDQCVRTRPGGKLREFNHVASSDPKFADYLNFRSGRSAGRITLDASRNDGERIVSSLRRFLGMSNSRKIYALKKRFERIYVSLIVGMLPNWFRRYHVAMTDPGEKHIWLYTSRELHEMLNGIGFIDTQKLKFDTTNSKFQELLSLDCLPGGGPRKGALSMFIEATKP